MAVRFRSLIVRFAVLSAAMLGFGLLLPVVSTAAPNANHAEERATRFAERAAHRAEMRAAREQEREARRAARAQEREARRAARAQERAARQTTRNSSNDSAIGEVNESPPGPSSPAEGQRGGHGKAVNAARGCELTAAATAQQVTIGETVTLFGKLVCASGVSAADQPITLYQHQPPSALSAAATATTAADGSYRLTPSTLTANTIFLLRTPGARRARIVVRVAPAVTLVGPPQGAQLATASPSGHPFARSRVTFTGALSPAIAGTRVALQLAYVASGSQWHSVAYGRVDSAGHYSIAHAFGIPGEVSIRTVARAGRTTAAAVSESLSYEVPQPQNPALTIKTSADPLQYGASVTISGVALGAANKPVTLLARTQGPGFLPVAQGTTDANGSYTFTQAPLQATYYKVASATATSTALFESVRFALTPASAPHEVSAGEPLTFSGTLSPARIGQVVYLERKYTSGLGFYIAATGAVVAGSEYKIDYVPNRNGPSIMRIRVPSDSGVQATFSEQFTIAASP